MKKLKVKIDKTTIESENNNIILDDVKDIYLMNVGFDLSDLLTEIEYDVAVDSEDYHEVVLTNVEYEIVEE